MKKKINIVLFSPQQCLNGESKYFSTKAIFPSLWGFKTGEEKTSISLEMTLVWSLVTRARLVWQNSRLDDIKFCKQW